MGEVSNSGRVALGKWEVHLSFYIVEAIAASTTRGHLSFQ